MEYQEMTSATYVAYFPTTASEQGWPSPSTSFWMIPDSWHSENEHLFNVVRYEPET